MSLIKSIIFGIIQGLCEFLPVSSSGHLALAHSFFGVGEEVDALAFDVLLHFGTLIAVVLVFRKDIWELVKGFFSLIGKVFHGNFKLSEYGVYERFALFMLIAIIPLIPAAFLDDKVEILMGYPIVIGCILIFNSFVLWLADRLSKGSKGLEEMKPKNALVIGLVQLIAVFPGLSRSGSTITGATAQGFTREFAVRFSFILSIPAILGACVLKLPDFVSEIPDGKMLAIYASGAIAAAVTGVLAIKLISWIAKNKNFKVFSVYCLAIGVATVIWGIVKAV